MMTEEVRKEIDELRNEIRQIGATLKGFRQDLDEINRIKTGPQGEIDLDAWNQAEEIRQKIRDCESRRDEVQARLNDLLRPFKAKKVIPALRERGISVQELLTAVKEGVPDESPSARYLRAALDEAMAIEDEGTALGKLLDLFLFGEVRRTVERVLEIQASNGNGG
ncbi:MAG: hypothetical protein O7H41_13925 [Planctomycetota bacterium]|nr:hypothetical protein [Planctomycetota bacterium]